MALLAGGHLSTPLVPAKRKSSKKRVMALDASHSSIPTGHPRPTAHAITDSVATSQSAVALQREHLSRPSLLASAPPYAAQTLHDAVTRTDHSSEGIQLWRTQPSGEED